jgi:hypothetical protein
VVIKNAVAVGNDKNRLILVFFDEKQFAKFIVMHYGIGSCVVAVQSVISLNPIFIISRINNLVDEVSRQEIFLILGLVRVDVATVLNIPSVAGADHHQTFLVLAQTRNRTVR